MIYVVGIDPGPVTGVVLLKLDELEQVDPPRTPRRRLVDAQALQCTPGLLGNVMHGLAGYQPAVACELFVTGNRAARSSTAVAGETTRGVVGVLADWTRARELDYWAVRATDVKPWATNLRMSKAGLLDLCKGMRHALDAARHALYRSVKSYGLADPLSREWVAR